LPTADTQRLQNKKGRLKLFGDVPYNISTVS
jgi:hypothetical protein